MKRTQDSSKDNSNKHAIVQCPTCAKAMWSDKLNRHLATHIDKMMCRYCKKEIREDRLSKHEILCKDKVNEKHCNRTEGVHEHLENDPDCSSVSGLFNLYTLEIDNSSDYDVILNQTCTAAKKKLVQYLKKHPVKVQIVISLVFYKNDPSGERVESEKVFRSACEPLLIGNEVDGFLARAKETVRIGIDTYQRFGSGWIFDKLCSSKLEIARYSPLSASGSVRIPKKLKNTQSVLNIKSGDNKCFLYCLLAKLYPWNEKNAERYTKYLPYVDKVNMAGVEFPVKLSDISKIENLNNLSISVFQWWQENEWSECIIPLRHGCGIGTQIDLLYIEDEEMAHYMLVKNFNAFMRMRTKHHHTMFYCRKCLHGFVKESKQKEHSHLCQQGINQYPEIPSSGSISFKSTFKQDKKLFAVYFDFECLTVPYSTCFNSESKSSTMKYQKHVPCSFCIVTTSAFKQYKKEVIVFSNPDSKCVFKTFVKE